MEDIKDPRGGMSRRGVLGGLGLTGATGMAGGAQLANFLLGSTPAFA